MNLSVILKHEPIILFIIFQCAIVLPLKHIFSTYCESFYGCELFNFTKPYMSKLYISWRKIIRYIFLLSPRTHNYIVYNLWNCIMGRLDRRLCKYIIHLKCIVRILLNSKL